MFYEGGLRFELFRGTMRDLGSPDVSGYCGPIHVPYEPGKPLILVRWLS